MATALWVGARGSMLALVELLPVKRRGLGEFLFIYLWMQDFFSWILNWDNFINGGRIFFSWILDRWLLLGQTGNNGSISFLYMYCASNQQIMYLSYLEVQNST